MNTRLALCSPVIALYLRAELLSVQFYRGALVFLLIKACGEEGCL